MMRKIRAIIFDSDGVLVDSLPAHIRTYEKVLKGKCKVKPRDIYLREGLKAEELIASLLKRPVSKEIVEIARKRDQLYREEKVSLFKNVERVLKTLRKNYKLGLATGSSRSNVESTSSSILPLFDAVVSADNVEKGKPSPEVYLKCAEMLNVEPEKCVVIENAPLGLAAAKNAGMQVMAITTTLPPNELEGADKIISSLEEIPQVVEGMG